MITVSTVYLNGCNYQFGYDLLSQNTAGNYSVVRFYGVLNVTNNYVAWTRGSAQVWNSTANLNSRYNNGSYTVVSGTETLYHDSNGYYSATVTGSLNTTFTSGNGSGTMTLPRILRYPVISSATDFNDEENPTMYFTSYNTFPIRTKIEAGGNTQLITRDLNANATSCTFTLTDEERTKLRKLSPNSNSLSVRFTVCAMDGSKELSASYVDKTMTIVNANPTFKDFTYKDTNSTITELTGNDQILVKGLSTLQVDISSTNKMVANKNATAKNYLTTISNKNISTSYSDTDLSVYVGTIDTSGTQTLNVRAYDSRNNSTLVSKDITIYDYAEPVINATATRLNNWEKETTLEVSGSFSDLVIDKVAKNTIKYIQYRYKETNGIWNNWTNMVFTINGSDFTCTDIILSLDNTKSFVFEIKVVDNISAITQSTNVSVGEAIFFISTNQKKCYINGSEVVTVETISDMIKNGEETSY